MRRRIACAMAVLLWLAGCNSTFDIAAPANDEALYARLYPFYAELCAVSQISKKPGFGADTSGGWGGHSVFYLNGVCRDRDVHYPTVTLCGEDVPAADQGVGLSVNAHFKNANWVATDGREFFFHGGMSPQERLTRAAYDRTQAEAEKKGLYDGIVFHDVVFDDMPAGGDRHDFMYEVSVGTDYAIAFARDRYCARVPLTRAQMVKVIDYLNSVNAEYKDGKKDFVWNVLENNCTHLAHNALAAAGIWNEWETDRFLLISAFDFPVPKNEFVNLMRRTNDTDLSNPRALYADSAARRELFEDDRLPVEPGALASAEPVMQQNDIYNTDLHLIFYDDPFIGSYDSNFRTIFKEPRYTDIRANLQYVAARYRAAAAKRNDEPAADRGSSPEYRAFAQRFYDHVAHESAAIEAQLALVAGPASFTTYRP